MQDFSHGANNIDACFEEFIAKKREELKSDTKGTYQSRLMKRREAVETWKKTAAIIEKYGGNGINVPFYKNRIN